MSLASISITPIIFHVVNIIHHITLFQVVLCSEAHLLLLIQNMCTRTATPISASINLYLMDNLDINAVINIYMTSTSEPIFYNDQWSD